MGKTKSKLALFLLISLLMTAAFIVGCSKAIETGGEEGLRLGACGSLRLACAQIAVSSSPAWIAVETVMTLSRRALLIGARQRSDERQRADRGRRVRHARHGTPELFEHHCGVDHARQSDQVERTQSFPDALVARVASIDEEGAYRVAEHLLFRGELEVQRNSRIR